MKKLKKNDNVVVIAGKEKGKAGKVLKIDWKNNRVFVEGLNLVVRSTKPTQVNPNGGFTQKEAGIHLSNIAIASPKLGKATRVKIVSEGGKTKRVAKACGSTL